MLFNLCVLCVFAVKSPIELVINKRTVYYCRMSKSKQTAIASRKAFILLAILFAFTALISGCGEQHDKQNNEKHAAPLGNQEVLESLADAYRKASAKLPVSPGGLTLKGKRAFLETVFENAGYDYQTTLLHIAGKDFNPEIQYHKDLAELVLFPQTGLSENDLNTLYSEAEIKAVKILRVKMH